MLVGVLVYGDAEPRRSWVSSRGEMHLSRRGAVWEGQWGAVVRHMGRPIAAGCSAH